MDDTSCTRSRFDDGESVCTPPKAPKWRTKKASTARAGARTVSAGKHFAENTDREGLLPLGDGRGRDDQLSFFRAEFSSIRKRLDDLAQGQLDLRALMEQVPGNVAEECSSRRFRVAKPDKRPGTSKAGHTASLQAGHTASLQDSRYLSNGLGLPAALSSPWAGDGTNHGTASQMLDVVSGMRKRNSDMTELLALLRVAGDAQDSLWSSARFTETNHDTPRHMSKREKLVRKLRDHFWTREGFVKTLDMLFVLVICANAVVIGVSMDAQREHEKTWMWIDVVFSGAFAVELLTKAAVLGFRRQFCSYGRFSNCFDAFLIMCDLVQLIFNLMDNDMEGLPTASLFRIVRLLRLGRVLRLFRLEFFRGLLAMINGLIIGAPTLCCAMGLFCVVMYVAALVFREVIGYQTGHEIVKYFDTVPRSMFTIFRCSFGDCSSDRGTPIFEEVTEHFGPGYGVLYSIFMFLVGVGLFNVISAIFVEETMKAAANHESAMKAARLQDDELWASCIGKILHSILDHQHRGARMPTDIVEYAREIAALQLDVDEFDEVLLTHPEAVKALLELDIQAGDHKHLSDILDPDNSGVIDTFELIDGLRRLRGDPRRSDIVQVDMMIRAMQRDLNELMKRTQDAAASTPAPAKRQTVGVSGQGLGRPGL